MTPTTAVYLHYSWWVQSPSSRSRSRAAAMLGIRLPHEWKTAVHVSKQSHVIWNHQISRPPFPTSRCRIVISLFQRRCFSPSRNYNGWRQRFEQKPSPCWKPSNCRQSNTISTIPKQNQQPCSIKNYRNYSLQSHFYILYHFFTGYHWGFQSSPYLPRRIASKERMRRWQRRSLPV